VRRVAVLSLLTLCALASAACSLAALDGFSSGPGASPEADAGADRFVALAPDGGPRNDAAAVVDGSSPPPSLIPNGGFEDATADRCGEAYPPGTSFNSVVTPVTLAHTGSFACRVCNEDGAEGENYTLDPLGFGTYDAAPGRFALDAWVRAEGSGPVSVGIALRIYDGADERDFDNAPRVDVGAGWTHLTHEVEITKTGKVEVLLYSPVSVPRRCFVVDDVVLRQLP
jgi:hypothetical protein